MEEEGEHYPYLKLKHKITSVDVKVRVWLIINNLTMIKVFWAFSMMKLVALSNSKYQFKRKSNMILTKEQPQGLAGTRLKLIKIETQRRTYLPNYHRN